MKNAYIVAIVLLAAFMLFGCLSTEGLTGTGGSPTGGFSGTSPAGIAPAESAPPYAADNSNPSQPQKMVIKTGSANVEVPSGTLADRYAQFKTLVSSYGGELTDTSYTETESEKYYYVTVKLDPAKFEEFGTKLATIGTVKSLTSSGEDVTTQYIDITAKLNNLKASRDRLMELYNRTSDISEILQIEQELTRLQYDIDSTTQQKLYYERQAAKATMTVQIVEPAPAVDKTILNPLGQLANIFMGALVLGLTLVVGLAGFGIPVAIVLGLLYLIVKKVFLKGKKPEKEKK